MEIEVDSGGGTGIIGGGVLQRRFLSAYRNVTRDPVEPSTMLTSMVRLSSPQASSVRTGQAKLRTCFTGEAQTNNLQEEIP